MNILIHSFIALLFICCYHSFSFNACLRFGQWIAEKNDCLLLLPTGLDRRLCDFHDSEHASRPFDPLDESLQSDEGILFWKSKQTSKDLHYYNASRSDNEVKVIKINDKFGEDEQIDVFLTASKQTITASRAEDGKYFIDGVEVQMDHGSHIRAFTSEYRKEIIIWLTRGEEDLLFSYYSSGRYVDCSFKTRFAH